MDPSTNIIRIQLPVEKGKGASVKTRTTTSKNRHRVNAKLATHTIKREGPGFGEQDDLEQKKEKEKPRIETPAEQVLERRHQQAVSSPTKEKEKVEPATGYHIPDIPQTGYSEIPVQAKTPVPDTYIPTIGLDGKVKWGCLKNGTLPTYRTLRNKIVPPPPTYSVTDYSIAPTPIRNLDIPVTPLTTADLLAKQRAERALTAPKQVTPLQKRTIRRTRSSGLSKDKKQVVVQLSSVSASSSSSAAPVSVSDMKRYLVRRNLMDSSSSAPIDLIRELYQTAVASDEN